MSTTSHPTKRDLIVDRLRRMILAGELARGARLPQDELAARFGSSITPVREALRALESEGLVVSEPHRGTRVAAVDLEQVKGTYVVRRLVEAYAVRRATTRLSPRDLRRAEELLEECEQASADQDAARAREANRDFHFVIYDRCGIPSLTRQIDALWAAFPWDLVLSTPERAAESTAEHRAVLAAVRVGDPDAAAEAVEAHIAHGFAALTARMVSDGVPDPFDLDTD